MRLFVLSNQNYLFVQERDDEVALDITLFDKNKELLDGGVFETDLDIDDDKTISECLDFMDVDSVSFWEVPSHLIEDFDM